MPKPVSAGPKIKKALGPHLSASMPAGRAIPIISKVKGRKVNPDCSWLYPCACTRLSERNSIADDKPAYKKNVSKLTPEKTRLAKRRSGIMACWLLRSMAIKTSSSNTPRANDQLTVQLLKPTAGIRRKPKVRAARPSAIAATPGRSRGVFPASARSLPPGRSRPAVLGACPASVTRRERISKAMIPMGTLMKKMYRHRPASASAPPTTGPRW